MLSYQNLKKTQLLFQTKHKREHAQVMEALWELDPTARALVPPEALTSKDLVKALWDALPEEHEALRFAVVTEPPEPEVPTWLGTPTGNVTLHLGWGMLAFSASFEAAWRAWPRFHRLHTDAYNACIYPADLRWYLVRAGAQLYPMDCTRGPAPVLRTK